MVRTSKKPAERKREMMEIALQLFMEKGFEETAVSDIVNKAGVAQGTFYYHFKSKEEILDAILKNIISESIQAFDVLIKEKSGSGIENLRTLLDYLGEISGAYDSIGDYLHSNKYNLLHVMLEDMFIEAYAPILSQILVQGREEGEFHLKHESDVALVLITGMTKLLHDHIYNEASHMLDLKLESLEFMFNRLLGLREKSIHFSSLKCFRVKEKPEES